MVENEIDALIPQIRKVTAFWEEHHGVIPPEHRHECDMTATLLTSFVSHREDNMKLAEDEAFQLAEAIVAFHKIARAVGSPETPFGELHATAERLMNLPRPTKH